MDDGTTPLLKPIDTEDNLHVPHIWTDVELAKILIASTASLGALFEISVENVLSDPVFFWIDPKNDTREFSRFKITIEEVK